LQSVLPSGEMPRLEAPWVGWFDRRRTRSSWLGFSQSMAFLGFVQGMGIHYRVGEDGQPFYGVSKGASHCWFGLREWQVNGEGGRMLGISLWQEFLNAGGPWPTEFRLRATPRGGLRPGHRAAFIRQGERCQQLWELPESRDRPGWF
jgi:hypothetical protein